MNSMSGTFWPRIFALVVLAGAVLGLGWPAQAAPLTAGAPIPLPGTHGKFDFIRIDTAANRLLLNHEANGTLDVFDLNSLKLLKSVPTGTAQDVAVDMQHGNYYVSANDPGRLVIVDAKSLDVTGAVPLPAGTDLIGYDPVTGRVHLCNDAAPEEWVIDPQAKKIVATIQFAGHGLEDLAFDPQFRHLYQAEKGTGTIAVVDPSADKVLKVWSLAPDKGPHGIAVVPDGDGLLAACNGQLVLIDRATGKVLDRVATALKVDEIAYDPGLHTAYCPSKEGEIAVVKVSAAKLTALGSVPDERGARSIAVDPSTHTVWIAYDRGDVCFVQPFIPSK